MRLFFFLFLALLFSSCVSSKRFNEQTVMHAAELAKVQAKHQMSQDSMLNLRLALERVRGGNASLLIIQERLQERLQEKEDAL
ncbi:MAG: hypothetical protein AAFZ52_01570, partial [Bacteroidota bacterium]